VTPNRYHSADHECCREPGGPKLLDGEAAPWSSRIATGNRVVTHYACDDQSQHWGSAPNEHTMIATQQYQYGNRRRVLGPAPSLERRHCDDDDLQNSSTPTCSFTDARHRRNLTPIAKNRSSVSRVRTGSAGKGQLDQLGQCPRDRRVTASASRKLQGKELGVPPGKPAS
jgi:hypothetical protein